MDTSETFTLIVSWSDDGIETTPAEDERVSEMFCREVERVLAADYGYGDVTVETARPEDVQTLVQARHARAEWEMQDALGVDVWQDICDEASERAWAAA